MSRFDSVSESLGLQHGTKSSVCVLYDRNTSTELKRNLILNAHNLSYPVTSQQELSHLEISLVGHLKPELACGTWTGENKSGEEQTACCPLLVLPVEDCHGRKTGGPNINCLLFHLECPLPCAQEQVLEGLSAHMLLQVLFQKPRCSEKTSKPSSWSTLSKASFVMQAIHKRGRISSAVRASGNGIHIPLRCIWFRGSIP